MTCFGNKLLTLNCFQLTDIFIVKQILNFQLLPNGNPAVPTDFDYLELVSRARQLLLTPVEDPRNNDDIVLSHNVMKVSSTIKNGWLAKLEDAEKPGGVPITNALFDDGIPELVKACSGDPGFEGFKNDHAACTAMMLVEGISMYEGTTPLMETYTPPAGHTN